MAEEPSRVKARFYTKELNKAGIYLMFFFINGRETPVYVDEYIPVSRYSRQEASFAKFHGNKLWVMLMEKAWAKICGTYARSDGGFPGIAAEHGRGDKGKVSAHTRRSRRLSETASLCRRIFRPHFSRARARTFAGSAGDGARNASPM